MEQAREHLDALLAAAARLESESKAWWNQYLGKVPRLEVPDETFARNFLWSWADFQMRR